MDEFFFLRRDDWEESLRQKEVDLAKREEELARREEELLEKMRNAEDSVSQQISIVQIKVSNQKTSC